MAHVRFQGVTKRFGDVAAVDNVDLEVSDGEFVVLPLALPGIAAAAIFVFIISWNEVFAASILTLRHQTLPAHVLAVLNESPLPFRFAGGFFMLAPSLIVIFVIRKYVFNMWGRVVR